MKRFLIAAAVLVVFGILSISCNNYVCPAYSQDADQAEQTEVAKV